MYSRILDYELLTESRAEFLKFHNFFEENRIFLKPHVKEKFLKVDSHIWSAWVSRKISLDPDFGSNHSFSKEAYEKNNNEIVPLIEEIEAAIQRELFPVDLDNKLPQ